MRDWNKRMYLSVFWILVGAVLFALGCAGKLDSFWSGMGGALLGIGIVQTMRWARYRKDPEYRENFNVKAEDERNRFLSNKAWAWAGYISVLAGAIGVIVFKIMDRDDLSMFCSVAMGFLLVLYWGIYFILNKKY